MLGLTTDQRSLAEAVASLAAAAAPVSGTRQHLEELAQGALPTWWKSVVDSGFTTVHLPDSVGGGGSSTVEAAVVLAEAGRALLPGPLTSTVLVGLVLSDVGGEPLATFGPRLVAGAAGGCATTVEGVTATRTPSGFQLDGTTELILDAPAAELVIVGARNGDTEAWFVLDIDTDGLRVEAVTPVDTTRSVGRIVLSGVSISDDAMLQISGERIRALTAVAFAAEASGTVRWCLDTAVAYVKVREQFGQPVGSFQAVKHKLASLFMRVSLIESLAWDAARAADQDDDQLQLAAAAAAVLCLSGSRDGVLEAITSVGGIGFTWEHDLSLYWRRATAVAQVLDGSASWSARLVSLLTTTSRDFSVDVGDTAADFRAGIAAKIAKVAELSEPQEQRRLLADAGLVCPHYPQPYGVAASAVEQVIIDEELKTAGLKQPSMLIGEFILPTIIGHGTEAQQQRFVPPTLRGELIWCQLFSEPEAGSDLAALRTRATKVDGGWLLNGQKLWTSLGHLAHWGACLARTDPDAPKHKGISYFLVDMRSPGVEIRPLVQSTGHAEFNEIFLADVFVPDDCLIGAPEQGWRIASTTLANERLMISSNLAAPILEVLLDRARTERFASEVAPIAGRLAAESIALNALALRTLLTRIGGLEPGAATSVLKVATVDLRRAQATAVLETAGSAALEAPAELPALPAPGDFVLNYLLLPKILFGGGTREIQLNVIAERVLGLPR